MRAVKTRHARAEFERTHVRNNRGQVIARLARTKAGKVKAVESDGKTDGPTISANYASFESARSGVARHTGKPVTNPNGKKIPVPAE